MIKTRSYDQTVVDQTEENESDWRTMTECTVNQNYAFVLTLMSCLLEKRDTFGRPSDISKLFLRLNTELIRLL